MTLECIRVRISDHMCDIMNIPCHTQSVEMCVKAVTEVSMTACGEERRNGIIINTLKSRQSTLIFRTKSNVNLSEENVGPVSI